MTLRDLHTSDSARQSHASRRGLPKALRAIPVANLAAPSAWPGFLHASGITVQLALSAHLLDVGFDDLRRRADPLCGADPCGARGAFLGRRLSGGGIAHQPRRSDPAVPEGGGPSRNRTGVQGFAVLCVTTPPSGRKRAEALMRETLPVKAMMPLGGAQNGR
jgi:hypothetical protein